MPMLESLGRSETGKSYYHNKGDITRLIRYVTRTRPNETRTSDLISYGGCGVSFNYGVNYIIDQIKQTQKVFDMDDRGGRRMLHEVYSFSDEDFYNLGYDYGLVDYLAKMMYTYYYSKGHEVIYAIHDDSEKHLHIHIVANYINFIDGKKFDSGIREYYERRSYFDHVFYLLVSVVDQIKIMNGLPIPPVYFSEYMKRQYLYKKKKDRRVS